MTWVENCRDVRKVLKIFLECHSRGGSVAAQRSEMEILCKMWMRVRISRWNFTYWFYCVACFKFHKTEWSWTCTWHSTEFEDFKNRISKKASQTSSLNTPVVAVFGIEHHLTANRIMCSMYLVCTKEYNLYQFGFFLILIQVQALKKSCIKLWLLSFLFICQTTNGRSSQMHCIVGCGICILGMYSVHV